MGVLPTKNFSEGVFDRAEDISGEKMTETILKTRDGCFACPVRCIRVTKIDNGPYAGDYPDGPEYETLASFGSLCLNGDLSSIVKMNNLCNLYGLDTISTGVTIAFTMECYENGLLTKQNLGGIELSWGSTAGMIHLIGKIARREGVGDLLADGVRRASEKVGHGSARFAMHVKGLEVPLHDPRGKKGVGLMYAVANRGAVHTDGAHDPLFSRENAVPELGLTKVLDRLSLEGKAEMHMKMQDSCAIEDSLIVCFFTAKPGRTPTTFTNLRDLVYYAKGWKFTTSEFLQIGERINNLGRAFNIREGFGRKDDTLPARFAEPMPEGNSKNQSITGQELDKLLDEYYALRGWDRNGIPTAGKLEELGLELAAERLKQLGHLQ